MFEEEAKLLKVEGSRIILTAAKEWFVDIYLNVKINFIY